MGSWNPKNLAHLTHVVASRPEHNYLTITLRLMPFRFDGHSTHGICTLFVAVLCGPTHLSSVPFNSTLGRVSLFAPNTTCQVSAHFGTKLYEACKHLDTDGEGSITTGQLRKLFFGDYTAPEGSDNKVGVFHPLFPFR